MMRGSSKACGALVSVVVGAHVAACAADAGDPLKADQTVAGPDGAFSAAEASPASDALGTTTYEGGDAQATPSIPDASTLPSDDAGTTIGGDPDRGFPDASPCSTCAIELKYLCATTDAMSQGIRPHVDIINNAASAQSLTELTVRYYFTADGSQTQTYNCDYALVGCSLIHGTFVTMATPKANADHYLEVSFTGGSIAPGGHTGEIQNRFQDSTFAVLTQTNDYSFDATKTAYTDWSNVTVYRSGTLVWGTEP